MKPGTTATSPESSPASGSGTDYDVRGRAVGPQRRGIQLGQHRRLRIVTRPTAIDWLPPVPPHPASSSATETQRDREPTRAHRRRSDVRRPPRPPRPPPGSTRGSSGLGTMYSDGEVVADDAEDRLGGGHLHLLGDAAGARVQRAAEHTGERQHVVDLVQEVAAAGRDDGGVLGGDLRMDLRVGVGQSRTRCLRAPSSRSAPRARRPPESPRNMSAPLSASTIPPERPSGLVRCARSSLDRRSGRRDAGCRIPRESSTVMSETPAARRMFAHAMPAAPTPEITMRSDAMSRSSTLVAPSSRGEHDDRGAVLVVVHDRAVQRLDEAPLDLEAARRRDVLEVHRTERRPKPHQGLDDLVGILGVQHDRDRVQAAERLEQRASCPPSPAATRPVRCRRGRAPRCRR